MQVFSLESIGTHLEIRIRTDQSCESLFRQIESRLRIFEQKYSRFIEGNWLATLNKTRSAVLDADGIFMLQMMLQVAKDTNGYFDPTVGKRLAELGYGRIHAVNDNGPSGYGDYRDIELDADEVKLGGDIVLEFGGAGKGYLIDVIREIIDGYFSEPIGYLINFGGDMYGIGQWKVGLESPWNTGEAVGIFTLHHEALACSAPTRRRWGIYHHLIDPKTNASSQEVVSSFVTAATASFADMYATALAVMPWDLACRFLLETDTISGALLRSTGESFVKPHWGGKIFLM